MNYENIYKRQKTFLIVILILFIAIIVKIFITQIVSYNKINKLATELWNKANNILNERAKRYKNNDNWSGGLKYPFSSKIYCKEHNCSFQRSSSKRSSVSAVWCCGMYLKFRTDACLTPIIVENDLIDIVKPLGTASRKGVFVHEIAKILVDKYNKVIEELNTARQRLGVNTLEQYSELLVIFFRDVKYLDLKNKYVDVNALKECFDYHKLALLLAKMMLDNTKLTIKLEGMVHNCWQEVLTYINIVEDSTNKHYNPVIKYYNSKSRSIETFSFKDLKKEVAKIMASPVNYQTVSVSFEEAISEGISYDADAASKYINDVLSERAKRELMASWEIIRKGEREERAESARGGMLPDWRHDECGVPARQHADRDAGDDRSDVPEEPRE